MTAAKRVRGPGRPGIHKIVVDSVRRLSKQGPAVKVSRIARDTKKDQRTVQHHLELMEAGGQLVFLDDAHTVVGDPVALAKVLRNAIIEPFERAGFEELRPIWDNEQDDVYNQL